jgi:hypothetical protein
MFAPGNTSPCHVPLHLLAQTAESHMAGIAQQLSDRALRYRFSPVVYAVRLAGSDDLVRLGQHHTPAFDPEPVVVPRVIGHSFETFANHSLIERK